ncbi:Deleted in malignant brain tumors 1 protein [Geodia barretti]|nr:Deleted in malignant brain tumors 1 protein [Geodia barretti]
MYGQGIGYILYDEMDCTGLERNLSDCRSAGLLVNDCQHSEDAGVLCRPREDSPCSNGELRLTGGRDSTEGRVEFCFNGRWGTVCDDRFGDSDARVICRQLGFPAGYGQSGATFGQGAGPIFLDDLDCLGNETTLLSCRHDGVGFHNCQHSEDASVICLAAEERCIEGDVRLMNGDYPNEGRVEICISNHWGTVCDYLFDASDARVVCNQLGYTNGDVIQVQDGYYGAGRGMVWLSGLECSGNETRLLDCPLPYSSRSCSHSSDVSIICPITASGGTVGRCSDGAVRLVNGSLPNEGLVEICYNGRWGAICEDQWDTLDATVVCHQMGFPGDSVIAVGKSLFSSSSGPIFLDSVDCQGTESRLDECFDRSSLGTHSCRDVSGHAGVICPSIERTCDNGEVRLVGGGTLLEGRVEVCYNSRWGTVCDNMWDRRDARVVCRQVAGEYGLEYDDFFNPVAVRGSGFGRGSGPVFLTDLLCVGSEQNLLECRGAEVGVYDCSSAGIYCGLQPCKDGSLRLAEGLPGSNNTGRVEMCIRNVWAGLCDTGFDDRNAEFVCSQLGLPDKNAVSVGGDFFGHGHHISSWSVAYSCDNGSRGCSLRATTKTECPHVGVFCEQMVTRCRTGHVRVVGGANSSEGRVEVCLNGQWGKICDDSWDDNAAKVVCGQLNLPTIGAKAVVGSSIWGSSPSLDYVLDDVKCFGSESKLLDCHSSPVLSHNCLHTEEAGVTCHGKTSNSGQNKTLPTETSPAAVSCIRGGGGGEEDMYSSGQVAAIILPVVLVMMVVLVSSLAGMWLVLQRRKRSVNQSDQFPIARGQGIVQFNEFSSESESLDKISGTNTAI